MTMEQYDKVCRQRFDSLSQDVGEIKTAVNKMSDRLFVGNGKESLLTRVALLEHDSHTPQTASKRVVFDLGKVAGGGGVVFLIQKLVAMFGG